MFGRPHPERLVVTRGTYDRSYTVRTSSGDYVETLTFRDVQALAACRDGRARGRIRRRCGQYVDDVYLEPECDVFGIGPGTLAHLQFRKLVQRPDEPGPLRPTDQGLGLLEAVLRHIAADRRKLARAA